MAEAVLGVDLGTTRVKAAVVDLEGRIAGESEGAYPVISDGGPGAAEQDAAIWWEAARDAMRQAVTRSRLTSPSLRVIAACVGGQGPSLVPVAEDGKPLARALIWMDQRTEGHRRGLAETLGAEVSPYAAIPRVMWLRERQPEATLGARWILQSWDYIAYRMTGSAVASTFRGASVFQPEQLAAAGLDPERFPREIEMGQVGGTVREDVARDLGIDPGIPVAGGVNDATATILGAGVVRKGLAIDYGGTSGGLGLAWDAPLVAPGTSAWPAPAEGLWICGGGLAAAGRSLIWLLETFGYAKPGTAAFGPLGAHGAEAAMAEAALVPAGAEGLIFLPYLAGERTPLWDESARGVLFGLTDRHGRGHIARAVLEGVAYSLRHVADVLREAGGDLWELRVSGGQSKSALWRQIKADVLRAPATLPEVTEGAVLGAAMLATLAAGRASDIAAAAERFVRVVERLEPDASTEATYAEGYRRYRELYPRLRDLMG